MKCVHLALLVLLLAFGVLAARPGGAPSPTVKTASADGAPTIWPTTRV